VVALGAARRRNAEPDTEPRAAVSDEAQLRARLAQIEQQITDVDTEIRQHETIRDASDAAIDEIQRSDGTRSALSLWKHEEARDKAIDAIKQLLTRRRPLAADRTRLLNYCDPIDAVRREITETEEAIATFRAILDVLPAVDALLARIAAAQGARRRARIRAINMPRALEQFERDWHDDPNGRGSFFHMGGQRHRLIYQHNVADLELKLQRLRGSLA
jgi:tetratricopeptide (TPR) repeat protein